MRTVPFLATTFVAVSCLAHPLAAQGPIPRLFASPTAMFSGPQNDATVYYDVTAKPLAAFVLLIDVDGGPVRLFGERFQLGFTPLLGDLASGQVPAWGQQLGSVTVPFSAGLVGVPFHLQAVVVNPAATNGLFQVSNGESTVLLPRTAAFVERFDDAAAEGFTGSFDTSVRDSLQGGPVRHRTQRTVDPQGMTFGLPIGTPLNAFGARAQLCYRAQDVGATGEEELVTAIRWRLFGGSLAADRFDQLEILLSHSDVVPDFTIDPWSALPMFPNSGLDPVYANNVKPGETQQTVYSGAYAIRPGLLRADGFVDYPVTAPFAYNGVDSLLLDLRMSPSTSAIGWNGQIVRLMVPTTPQPNARVVNAGTASNPVDPNRVMRGQGDNAMHEYQLEFTRVKTVAQSPWRQAGVASPDYQAPVVARVEPAGTSIVLEYRGADDAQGTNATAWSANIDLADGKGFLQYRISLIGDAASGAVPGIDTLVVPYR